MVDELEVVDAGAGAPADDAPPTEVVADVVMSDFTITPPANGFAEPGTYRFVNEGAEPHEVLFLRLEDGMTLADVAAYQAGGAQGEPPFTFEGGPAPVEPGGEVYADLDFRPGSWIALCAIRGAHTDMPHVDMGMLLPFEIPAG
jgi:hypothetical protein